MKILICYLRFIANPRDASALKYIINVPARGIGEKTVASFLGWVEDSKKLAATVNEDTNNILSKDNTIASNNNKNGVPGTIMDHLQSIVDNGGTSPENNSSVYIAPCPLNTREKKALTGFATLIIELRESASLLSLPNLLQEIVTKIGLEDYFSKENQSGNETINEGIDRIENIKELIKSTAKFDTDPSDDDSDGSTVTGEGSNSNNQNESNRKARLEQLQLYLQEVMLMASADVSEDEGGRDGANTSKRVSLMTIHAAKGTEFDTVFVTGMEEGVLPMRARDEGETLEDCISEERRLAFVAVTRAKTELYLLWRKIAMGYGSNGKFFNRMKISRFLAGLKSLPPSICVFQGK